MDKTSVSILKSCAKDLVEIRAQLPSNLEPGLASLLDSVIERLQQVDVSAHDPAARVALIDDALTLVGRLGEVAMVVAEIIGRFRG